MVVLTNMTCVVTGGKAGIGLEMTRQLIGKGNRVVVACRGASGKSAAKLKELQKKVEPGKLLVTELDVAEPSSIDAWATSLRKQVDKVDVVVNNAGVISGFRSLQEVRPEDMMHCFSVNAMGPLFVCQALLKEGLIGGNTETLVGNVTSKVGSIDDNGSGGGYAYRASKCALNMISKSMWIDLEPKNITTMLLHPGWVRTDMTNNGGLINVETSASGLICALEGKYGDVTGKDCRELLFVDYKGDKIKW